MSEANWFTLKLNDHEGPDVPESLARIDGMSLRGDVWKTPEGDIKVTLSGDRDFPLLGMHKSLTIPRASAERFAEAILDIAYG